MRLKKEEAGVGGGGADDDVDAVEAMFPIVSRYSVWRYCIFATLQHHRVESERI